MLRPTFLGFETAKRGIQVSQKGLDIVGQNMTNWDSAGYTRQRLDQVAIAASTYTTRFASGRVGVAGQGVDVSGVAQVRDSFLDKRFRDEYSDEGYYGQAGTILADIESAIGEFNALNDAGIRGSLQSLLPALQKLAGSPFSETNANIVCTEFRNLTQTLHQLDGKLSKVEEQQKFNLKTAVDQVNEKLRKVAALNYAISQDLGLTLDNEHYGPNELYDQRNLLLDELSQFGDLQVTAHGDGTVTVQMGTMTVVDGDKYERMEYVDNAGGTVTLRWNSTGQQVVCAGGALKGFIDFINGRGPNVTNSGETPYRGILYYRDKLNTFASTLAGVVNSSVPVYNSDGTLKDPPEFKELLGAMSSTPDADGHYEVSTDIPVTAANISLSDLWAASSSYIIPKAESKDNNDILQLYNNLANVRQTFVSGGQVYNGTFYDYVDDYAATLAEDYTFYDGRHVASATILQDLQDRRDSVSGVVLDEETASMLMYNKSLQAASRLMTTLDEALDVLINKTGLVGR